MITEQKIYYYYIRIQYQNLASVSQLGVKAELSEIKTKFSETLITTNDNARTSVFKSEVECLLGSRIQLIMYSYYF